MPICKKCGEAFDKWRPGGTWKYCPDCGYANAKEKGFFNRYQGPIVTRQRLRADDSGNPKIWRAGDPIEGLPPKMQERITKALIFGI
jgi:hypothetical protein